MNRAIKINGTWFVLNFMDKDIDVEYVKWHNFTMNNMFNANDFYIVQIVQEKDGKPRFYVEYFEIDSNGCKLGEWTYIDEYFSQENARKLKELLIQLSDAELRGEFEEEKIFGRDRLGRR